MAKISGKEYVSMYGPTVGDKVRLGDTDLFEGQQLDPVNNGILLRERIEKSHTFGTVVKRWNNDLPQRGGDLFFVQ